MDILTSPHIQYIKLRHCSYVHWFPVYTCIWKPPNIPNGRPPFLTFLKKLGFWKFEKMKWCIFSLHYWKMCYFELRINVYSVHSSLLLYFIDFKSKKYTFCENICKTYLKKYTEKISCYILTRIFLPNENSLHWIQFCETCTK